MTTIANNGVERRRQIAPPFSSLFHPRLIVESAEGGIAGSIVGCNAESSSLVSSISTCAATMTTQRLTTETMNGRRPRPVRPNTFSSQQSTSPVSFLSSEMSNHIQRGIRNNHSDISMKSSRGGSRPLLLAVLFLCASLVSSFPMVPMEQQLISGPGTDRFTSELRDQLGDELRAEVADSLSERHLKMRLLDHLRRQQLAHHNAQHQRLTDPMIFDPSLEELSLESTGSGEWPNGPLVPLRKPEVLDAKQNEVDTDSATTKAPSLLDSLEPDHPLHSIIQSGWIENASTATLIYYLQKISFLLSKEHELEEPEGQFANEPMIPEEDMILPKVKKGEEIHKNKNVESVLNRLMGTPNVVKKRGEGGPQLSIEYPLEVLRQKLMRELQRRQMESHKHQIDKNSKILEKLGRRRRRRSVVMDCDFVQCNLDDLNQRKWSNVHQSLAKLVQTRSPTLLKRKSQKRGGNESGGLALYSAKTRFRNNNKFTKEPQDPMEESHHRQKPETEPLEYPGLTYHGGLSWFERARINSKKPTRFGNKSGPRRSDDWWGPHLRLRKISPTLEDNLI